MKKVIFIAAALILAMLLTNVALGRRVGPDTNAYASSGSMDIEIVEREINYSRGEYASGMDRAASTINETISNLAPGDTVTMVYKIVNYGSVDAQLDGLEITTDNEELSNNLSFNWTVTHYRGSESVNFVTNASENELLAFSGGQKDVSFADIVLPAGSKAEDYCLLEMVVTFEEGSGAASGIVQETQFSVTPLFIQD
ncbi:MAG: hypothetical protein JXN65_01735 [Clostridia bacterium]|nr:hypothetical protein [Clostridia bacterium]